MCASTASFTVRADIEALAVFLIHARANQINVEHVVVRNTHISIINERRFRFVAAKHQQAAGITLARRRYLVDVIPTYTLIRRGARSMVHENDAIGHSGNTPALGCAKNRHAAPPPALRESLYQQATQQWHSLPDHPLLLPATCTNENRAIACYTSALKEDEGDEESIVGLAKTHLRRSVNRIHTRRQKLDPRVVCVPLVRMSEHKHD